MKYVRTEVHITVTTFVGDDIGEEKPPLSRSPDAIEACSVVRVSGLGPEVRAHETAKGHVGSLMANAACVLAEKVSHQLRSL